MAGGASSSNSLTKSRRLRSEVISAIASTLHALAVQPLDLGLDVLRRQRRDPSMLAGAVDAAGDELRIAGDQAEDVDILEEADE